MNSPLIFNNRYLNNLFNFYPSPIGIPSVHFNKNEISTITNNDFIPIINLTCCKVVDGIIMYPHINISSNYISGIIQRNFLNKLVYKNKYFNAVNYTDKGEEKNFYVGYGTIVNENNDFLFLVSFKGHLLEKTIPLIGEGLTNIPFSKKDIKIFITGDFMDNHRKFYNIILRKFLQDYIDSGCELSIMDSEMIKDSVYGNEFEDKSNFKTIEDKISFIEDFRNTILEYEQ